MVVRNNIITNPDDRLRLAPPVKSRSGRTSHTYIYVIILRWVGGIRGVGCSAGARTRWISFFFSYFTLVLGVIAAVAAAASVMSACGHVAAVNLSTSGTRRRENTTAAASGYLYIYNSTAILCIVTATPSVGIYAILILFYSVITNHYNYNEFLIGVVDAWHGRGAQIIIRCNNGNYHCYYLSTGRLCSKNEIIIMTVKT